MNGRETERFWNERRCDRKQKPLDGDGVQPELGGIKVKVFGAEEGDGSRYMIMRERAGSAFSG